MAAEPKHISATAKLSAYYRQFSDIPFAAEVATLIGADDTVGQITRDHGLEPEKLTFYAPMFEARYKSITQLIRTSGASQVLELASGYSFRGLDVTRDNSLCYVETDLPDVEQLRAATAVLDRSRSLLVLCEGLIGYLTREETGRVADNVRRLIDEFK